MPARRTVAPTVGLLAIVLLAGAAAAQDGSESAPESLLEAAADPSLSSEVVQKPQVTLVSTEDKSTVAGSLSIVTARSLIFGIKLQAPVQKGGGDVSLATLDGLTGGAQATLSVSKIVWKETTGDLGKTCRMYNESLPRPRPIDIAGGECTAARLGVDPELGALVRAHQRAAAETACREYNQTGAGPPFMSAAESAVQTLRGIELVAPPGYRAPCSRAELQRLDDELAAAGKPRQWVARCDAIAAQRLEAACKERNSKMPDGWISTGGPCTLGTLAAKGNARDGESWYDKGLAGLTIHRPWLLGLSLTSAKKSFKFADPETLAESSISKDGWAAAASAGVLAKGGTYYGLGYRREKSYSGKPASELCRPLAGTDALTCKEIALGGPTSKEKDQARFEARRYFGKHLGGALTAAHDFEDEVWGANLLVYFLQSKQKGLNGGIDLGYRDDTGDTTVRVFIGSSFRLLGS